MRKQRVLWVVAMCLSPATAAADSDGYYCAGPGYLAYEMRFSTPAPGHALHVVRFSRATGIVRDAPVPLEDFQVHGMTCHATAVVLAGWETRHTVDLADPRHPAVRAEPAALAPGHVQAGNLGHWSREGVVDLTSDGAPGEFQLVISRVARTIDGGVEHYTASRIIRRDVMPGGHVVASLSVFEGVFLETVDE